MFIKWTGNYNSKQQIKMNASERKRESLTKNNTSMPNDTLDITDGAPSTIS